MAGAATKLHGGVALKAKMVFDEIKRIRRAKGQVKD